MNLVNELQVSAQQDDVLTVLRKTARLASKLGREDIAEWLKAERDGYDTAQVVPDYRIIHCTIAYKTSGYVPAGYGMVMRGIDDLPHSPKIKSPLRDSISEVLCLIDNLRNGHGLYGPLPEDTAYSRMLRGHLDPDFEHQVSFLLHLNSTQVRAIPERLKDKVLEWACALEAVGVTGDGMSFSLKEREIANHVTFNINNSHIEQLTNTGTNRKDEG